MEPMDIRVCFPTRSVYIIVWPRPEALEITESQNYRGWS